VPLRPVLRLWFTVDLHPDVFRQEEIVKHFTLTEAVTGYPVPLQLIPSGSDRPNYKLVQLEPAQALNPNTDYLLLILPTLPAATGRTAGVVTTVQFRTTRPEIQIPVPLPLTPAHNARVETVPLTLSWQPWTTPPAGYQLLYRVELARDERFVDDIWFSVGDQARVAVPESETSTHGYYYWRVRIELVDTRSGDRVVGEWSPVVGFTVGPAARRPLGDASATITSSLDGVIDSLFREWPPLVLQSVPTGTAVTLYRRDADGYPSWEWV